jgi:hypothetical protein
MLHTTAVFDVLFTVAVNCFICPATIEIAAGLRAMLTRGSSLTLELADLLGSATLVAVIITV